MKKVTSQFRNSARRKAFTRANITIGNEDTKNKGKQASLTVEREYPIRYRKREEISLYNIKLRDLYQVAERSQKNSKRNLGRKYTSHECLKYSVRKNSAIQSDERLESV